MHISYRASYETDVSQFLHPEGHLSVQHREQVFDVGGWVVESKME